TTVPRYSSCRPLHGFGRRERLQADLLRRGAFRGELADGGPLTFSRGGQRRADRRHDVLVGAVAGSEAAAQQFQTGLTLHQEPFAALGFFGCELQQQREVVGKFTFRRFVSGAAVGVLQSDERHTPCSRVTVPVV